MCTYMLYIYIHFSRLCVFVCVYIYIHKYGIHGKRHRRVRPWKWTTRNGDIGAALTFHLCQFSKIKAVFLSDLVFQNVDDWHICDKTLWWQNPTFLNAHLHLQACIPLNCCMAFEDFARVSSWLCACVNVTACEILPMNVWDCAR